MPTSVPDFSWLPSTRARYIDQLEVLYPAAQVGRAFLVGEAQNHDDDGNPRYRVFRYEGEYQTGSRAVTIDEFRTLVTR